jgi:hypothetical protein
LAGLCSRSADATPSNIRQLRITGASYKRDEAFTSKVGSLLRGLPRVEKLDLSQCNVSDVLFLPPKLTSLTFGIVFNPRTLDNIGQLPLTHLDVTIGCAERANLEWMSAASWFNTLTSLSMSAYYIKLNLTANVLPPNLEQLVVGSPYNSQPDLGALVSTQSSLHSLTAANGWTIRSPLPSTLTYLSVALVIAERAVSLKDVVKFIPPSVTSLFVPNAVTFSYDGQLNSPVTQDDAVDFAELMIPRLTVASAAYLARRFAGVCIAHEGRLRPDNFARLGTAINMRLKRDGYADLHLFWMAKSLMSTTHDIGDHTLDDAFDLGLNSKKDIALFLESKRKVISSRCECVDHYAPSIKCLEWGLTHHLTLKNFTPPPLSEPVLLSLRKIRIMTRDLTGIDQFLAKYTFHCLETLVVDSRIETSDDISHMRDVVQAMHSNRARLPLLQKISFPRWYFWSVTMPAQTERLLNEMRLRRLVTRSTVFRYTVALPPPPPVVINTE